ncbi:MAG: glycosyltransferase family 4 protein [Nanoarchaeota archaeon]|nr:glycosyltransferase family 4 protein [Nanoarchaeota archaeon]
MKIAHVCPEYRPAISGVGQVVEELAKRQVALGHEVHVFTPDWDKEQRIKQKEEIIDDIYVHRCRHLIRVANFETIWPSVLTRLVDGRFDIIHSHLFGHFHFVLSSIASTFTKAKHIHTTHCPWSDAYRSVPGRIGMLISYNIFSRIAIKMTSRIIAITPWELDFIEKYGGSKDKISVVPNGMSKDFFKKIKSNDFKKNNNIKGDLVLFFGRLSPTKSPDKFVEIAKLILKERKNVIFVIRGPDEGLKQKVIDMIGEEKKIILLEATRDREEIIKMYQSADIFVMPSYREGLPLTLFEAMASGLPVVATPVNGIPYEMEDVKNGYLVPYENIEMFKDKIIGLLKNKKLRKKISANNLLKAKSYDWDKISKKTEEIYKN